MQLLFNFHIVQIPAFPNNLGQQMEPVTDHWASGRSVPSGIVCLLARGPPSSAVTWFIGHQAFWLHIPLSKEYFSILS